MSQKLISNYTCFTGKCIGCCVQSVAGLFKLNGLGIPCNVPAHCPSMHPQKHSGSFFLISQYKILLQVMEIHM